MDFMRGSYISIGDVPGTGGWLSVRYSQILGRDLVAIHYNLGCIGDVLGDCWGLIRGSLCLYFWLLLVF